MAAAYLRKLLEDAKVKNVEVRSAGVLTVTGLRASQEARQIMETVSVDLSRHRSSQLSPEMIRRADLILGMTPYHVQRALRISEDARGKTFLVKEYTRSDLKNIQISDPMGATLEVFKQRFKEIKKACELLVETPFVQTGVVAPPPPRIEAVSSKAKKAKASASEKPSHGPSHSTGHSRPAAKSKPAASKTAPKSASKAAVKKTRPATGTTKAASRSSRSHAAKPAHKIIRAASHRKLAISRSRTAPKKAGSPR